MDIRKIKVIVLEDDLEVAVFEIGYFEGQPYSVQIVTPDGVDRNVDREAGA